MLNISKFDAESLTKGEVKVLESLRKAYSNVTYDVYLYVQSTISKKRPDFIILDPKRGISILEVKDWTEDYIVSINKRKVELLDMSSENPAFQVKKYRSIIEGALGARDFDDIDLDDISSVVIFSNMSIVSKINPTLEMLFASDVRYIFKEEIKNLDIDNLFNFIEEFYDDEIIKKIRVALFPEIEILSSETTVNNSDEIKVLDFEQENFAKTLPLGHYMVTGIPGSGKTVILLARAIHLIKENPNWRVLILTYNKSLAYKLESKINALAELFKNDLNNKDINIDNIEVTNFHSLASKLAACPKPSCIERQEWFDEVMAKEAMKNAREIYDAVLIDEYQDFRMSWIELSIAICKSYKLDKDNKIVKNIFLAGDRLQSIYNDKDLSWKSIGIDMRGRSKLLKTSYRSANEHLNLALEFLKKDNTLKKEVEKFYSDEQDIDNTLEAINSGTIEFIQGDLSSIGEKIEDLKRNHGYKNKDFLVLASSKKICDDIIKKSNFIIKNQMKFVKEIESKSLEDNIIITTYHSSKGLEGKVVFLTNVDGIYAGDNAVEKTKRKILYVGITRTSEKLYICHGVNENGNNLKELKEIMN